MLMQIQSSSGAYDWSVEFHAWTSQHWIVVGVCAGLMALWCIVGRVFLSSGSEQGKLKERKLRHWIGWFILITQTFIFIRRFTPAHWDINDSLPLHMCRWDVWIVAWAMLTLNRKARALTLFWGLGLSSQVFVTPFLKEGHGSLGFWIYWLNHLQIVGVAVYDVVVLGYRPNYKDFVFATLAGIGFGVLVFVLNIILGTNYAYLGSGQHPGESVIDLLGPYPWRAFFLILGCAVVFVVMYGFSVGAMAFRTKILGKPPPRFVGPCDPSQVKPEG
jgi:hypothetical integral membrane protein (TIGR02206 family)